jgi:hypothetical protein
MSGCVRFRGCSSYRIRGIVTIHIGPRIGTLAARPDVGYKFSSLDPSPRCLSCRRLFEAGLSSFLLPPRYCIVCFLSFRSPYWSGKLASDRSRELLLPSYLSWPLDTKAFSSKKCPRDFSIRNRSGKIRIDTLRSTVVRSNLSLCCGTNALNASFLNAGFSTVGLERRTVHTYWLWVRARTFIGFRNSQRQSRKRRPHH